MESTGLFKYKSIEEKYGREILNYVKKYETNARTLGRYRSHLHFNMHCKHHDVIPKSLKMKPPINSPEARKLVHKVEKSLLNMRISETVSKLKTIKVEARNLLEKLSVLPTELLDKIKSLNRSREDSEFKKYTENQKKKFAIITNTLDDFLRKKREATHNSQTNDAIAPSTSLDNELVSNQSESHLTSQTTINTDANQESDHQPIPSDEEVREKWVKNLSKRPLSEIEKQVLRKGAGFAITPKHIPYDDYIIETEKIGSKLDKGQADALRAEVTDVLIQAKPPKSNMTKEELKALKELKKDKNIVFLKADKGKCIVVMNKDEYIKKMEEKLSDKTIYKMLDKDPTNQIKAEIVKVLTDMLNKQEIGEAYMKYLTPTETQIPRLYGQIKIHKEGSPLREILNSIGSVTKHIDKLFSNVIKSYTKDSPSYVKNSSHFVVRGKISKFRKFLHHFFFNP